MYIYMYICVYVCKHINTYTCIHKYIYKYVFIYVCLCIPTRSVKRAARSVYTGPSFSRLYVCIKYTHQVSLFQPTHLCVRTVY